MFQIAALTGSNLSGPRSILRVVQVFAKRGLLPSQLHSSLGGDDGDQLQIDVQVPDVDARTADLLAQSLRQIVMVECVLTSEKRPAEAGEARAA